MVAIEIYLYINEVVLVIGLTHILRKVSLTFCALVDSIWFCLCCINILCSVQTIIFFLSTSYRTCITCVLRRICLSFIRNMLIFTQLWINNLIFKVLTTVYLIYHVVYRSEKEMNRRRDMLLNLRSKVNQMATTLNMSNFANRDSLLGPEIKPADAMSRTTGLDNGGVVSLQRQIMKG